MIGAATDRAKHFLFVTLVQWVSAHKSNPPATRV